jgi:hypothetical protein
MRLQAKKQKVGAPDTRSRDEVLAAALDGALEQLSIQRTRFSALGPDACRLAISEAVWQSVRDLNVGANWPLQSVHFSGKTTADFTIQEIQQHYRLLNALVALVCLGDSSYIRPLVTYLSFPEPRWSLIIEPVLRALSRNTPPSVERLRSALALQFWRRWAAHLSASATLRRVRLRGSHDHEAECNFATRKDSLDSLWLVSSHVWLEEEGYYFRPEQARSCRGFQKLLIEHNYEGFLDSLNAQLEGNDLIAYANCDTLISELRDVLNSTSRAALLSVWSDAATSKRITPRTSAIMCRILKREGNVAALARQVTDWHLGANAGASQRRAVQFVFSHDTKLKAIFDVLDSFHSQPDENTQRVFDDLLPIVQHLVATGFRQALLIDTQNLCLLANESASGWRRLSAGVGRMRADFDRDVQRLATLHESRFEFTRGVGKSCASLLLQRRTADPSGDAWKNQTRTYLGRWSAVLEEWLRGVFPSLLDR